MLYFFSLSFALAEEIDKSEKEGLTTNIKKADYYYNLGEDCLDDYNTACAKFNFYQAIAIYHSSRSFTKLGNALVNQAIVYEIEGKLDSAIIFYKQAEQNYLKVSNPVGLADTYNNLGIVYCMKNQYEEGLKYFLLSLNIEKKLDNKEGIAYTLGNIGLIYKKNGNNDKAIKYFKESLDYKIMLHDKHGIAVSYINLGSVYEDLDSLSSAKQYYKKAHEIYSFIEDKEGIAYSLHNIGSIYKTQENYVQAIETFNEALVIREEINSLNGQIFTLFSIADSYFALQNYQIAESYLKKSLELASNQTSDEILSKIYYLYYQISDKQNKPEQALFYLSKHQEIQIILNEKQRQQSLIEMQEKYETERKENRISKQKILIENLNQENVISDLKLQRNRLFAILLALLILASVVFLVIVIKKSRDVKTMNKELNIKNEELAESNATKNKFFSIISHDLSNYAAIMETISSMIIRKKHTMDEEILEQNLLSLNKTTASNKYLISNLLQWAISQDNRISLHPEKINLYDFCNKIASSLKEIAKERNLIIQCDIDDSINVFADKNTISTVIRNLLSNAIKFAYKDTVIRLEASPLENQVLISVIDKGIGMTEETLQNLFKNNIQHTTKKRKAEEGTGLGLILCKDFVELNKGRIFVESSINKGSTFSFTLAVLPNEKNTDNHS